jgi:hypothetical protein
MQKIPLHMLLYHRINIRKIRHVICLTLVEFRKSGHPAGCSLDLHLFDFFPNPNGLLLREFQQAHRITVWHTGCELLPQAAGQRVESGA